MSKIAYVKRKAKCPVCEEEFVVTKAGVMCWHLGSTVIGRWRQMCHGVGQAPSSAAPTAND